LAEPAAPVTHFRLGGTDLGQLSASTRASGMPYQEATQSASASRRRKREMNIQELFMMDLLHRKKEEKQRHQEFLEHEQNLAQAQ
jgi:hypothetical protein